MCKLCILQIYGTHLAHREAATVTRTQCSQDQVKRGEPITATFSLVASSVLSVETSERSSVRVAPCHSDVGCRFRIGRVFVT